MFLLQDKELEKVQKRIEIILDHLDRIGYVLNFNPPRTVGCCYFLFPSYMFKDF